MATFTDPDGNVIEVGKLSQDEIERYRELDVTHRLRELEIDREARRRLNSGQIVEVGPPESLESFLTQEFPREVWTYQGLLEEGQKAVLAALYKTGKSTLLGNLLRADCDGGFALGAFPSVPVLGEHKVLYLNLEIPPRKMQQYLAGLDIKNPGRCIIKNLFGQRVDILNDGWFERIGNWISDGNVSRLIVDPSRRFHSGRENDNDDVAEVTGRLDSYMAQCGLSNIIVACHTPHEHREDDGEQFARARGGTVWSDWGDTLWSLVRDREGNRYFSTQGRTGELAPALLAMDESGSLSLDAQTSRADVKQEKVRESLLCRLALANGPLTATELKGRGRRAQDAGRALDLLVRDDWVRTWQDGNAIRYEITPSGLEAVKECGSCSGL